MSEDEIKKPDGDGPADESAAADADATAKAEAAAKAKAEAAAKAKAAAAAKAAAEAAKPPWERLPAAPETEDASDHELVAALRETVGAAIEKAEIRSHDLTLTVRRAAIREVATELKNEHGFRLLVDVCGVDYPKREEARFEVVYHVFNLETNGRVRLKVAVAEGEEVPTVVPVWAGANWCEREAYDMYGIRFADHPDMTRILMWEGFNGHPLRKDFPIEGVDTGAAIYPEYYDEVAGPVTGTGTGWKPPKPPEPEPEAADGETPVDA